jgi:hypothetical protein
MVRSPGADLAELRRSVPDGVIRSAELRAAGVSDYATALRCRPSGPWQRLLPGVVLMASGPPTRRQWLRAALAYTGRGSVLSGADALIAHGVDVPCPGDVLVLVAPTRRPTSRAGLTVERTGRLPEPVWLDGLPMAPVARAAIDAARREHDLPRLHAILLGAVRVGACTVTDLLDELDDGGRRGSAAPRAVLLARQRTPVPASPVLVGQLALDVADMPPGAGRAQPGPAALTGLDDPAKRLDRSVGRARPGAPGTPDVGLIGHETTLRRMAGRSRRHRRGRAQTSALRPE